MCTVHENFRDVFMNMKILFGTVNENARRMLKKTGLTYIKMQEKSFQDMKIIIHIIPE